MNTNESNVTSDSHSDSDEEDLKPGIPFIEIGDSKEITIIGSDNGYQSVVRCLNSDDKEPIGFDHGNWVNDGGGVHKADNSDYPSSNYSVVNGDAGNSFYNIQQLSPTSVASTTSTNATAQNVAAAYQDVKCLPSDMTMYPPSTSAMHFNYNYMHEATSLSASQMPLPLNAQHQQEQQQQQQHHHRHRHHPQHHGHGQHPPPHPQSIPPSQRAHLHRSNGSGTYPSTPYLHPSHQQAGPSFHSNMWYPNAPYGSRSYFSPYGSVHRYAQYNQNYPHDPMLDMLQLSNSGREARNRAEKNRRDKLNGSIQELSTMVPHVAESPRRVDKTAVLRFAAHGLRLQYVFGEVLNQQRPQLTDSLMKLLDSFFITLTCHGQIVLISSSIEQHLGHCQADLYGQNILHIAHPEDHMMLKKQLIPNDLDALFDVQPEDESGEPRARTQAEEDYIDMKLREDKRSFTVRLARAGPRSEPIAYEVVKIDGCFRRSEAAPRGIKTSTFPSSLQLIRRSRRRDDSIPLHTISGNDIVLIAIARIIRPPKVSSRVMEANTLEYRTRHLIDGRIIDCDQRIGLVAGYMTDEVRNLSPFTFMHQDDVRWVIVALRQMYDCHSSYGESTYRLLTRNGNFIYLQSKGYLEIDKDTNEVRSFICVNTLLDDDEGQRRVQEMKKKFSIIVNARIPQTSIDAPASENPQQLEKAVMCLIQNLQRTSSDEEDADFADTACTSSKAIHMSASTSHAAEARDAAASMHHYAGRTTKTPPLALVPPEPSSVKTSIFKSVSVVNVTAAKHFREIHSRVKSPHSPENGCDIRSALSHHEAAAGPLDDDVGDESNNICTTALAAQQKASTAIAGIGKRSLDHDLDEGEINVRHKRRLKSKEIEQVLSTSLDQIGRSLNQQLNAAIELRDKTSKYDVPNTNARIDEIMVEHQKQSEIYVNIKNEYEVQRSSTKHNKIIEVNTTKPGNSQPAENHGSNGDSHPN